MSTEAQNQVEEQIATEAVEPELVEAVVEAGNLPADSVENLLSSDPMSAVVDASTVTESELVDGGEAA
jgi:hypothetical protein